MKILFCISKSPIMNEGTQDSKQESLLSIWSILNPELMKLFVEVGFFWNLFLKLMFVTFVSCLLFEKSIKWKCMSQKIEYYRRYSNNFILYWPKEKMFWPNTYSKCAKLWRNKYLFLKIYLILLANYRFFHVLIQKKRQGREPPPPPPPNVRLTFLVEQIDMCDFPYCCRVMRVLGKFSSFLPAPSRVEFMTAP